MLNFDKEYFLLEEGRNLYPTKFLNLTGCEVFGRKTLSAHVYKIPNNYYAYNAGNIDFSAYPDGITKDFEAIKIVRYKPFFNPSIIFTKMGDITPENLEILKKDIIEHLKELEENIIKSFLFIDTGDPRQVNLPELPKGCVWFHNPDTGTIEALPVDKMYEKFDEMVNKVYEELKRMLEEYFNKLYEETIKKFQEEIDEFKKWLEEFKIQMMKDLCKHTRHLKAHLLYYMEQILKPRMEGYWECFRKETDEYVLEHKADLKGDPNVLTIGSVKTGKKAAAEITGESPNQILNLIFEKGDPALMKIKDNWIQVSYDEGVTWENFLEWTQLKGEKGEKGDIGNPPSMRSNLSTGYVEYSQDEGLTWLQLIRLSDIQGEQGVQGAKGDIPVKVEKVKEELDGVVFAMIYPDETELEFKIPYAVGTGGGYTAGDILPHSLTGIVPGNWMSFTNFDNIKALEYPDLASQFAAMGTSYYWQRKDLDDGTIVAEAYNFDTTIGGGGVKLVDTTIAETILPQLMKGGINNSINWANPYYTPTGTDAVFTTSALWITFKGTEIERLISESKPILIVFELDIYKQKYHDTDYGTKQQLYGANDIQVGKYEFLQGVNPGRALNPKETALKDYTFYANNMSTYLACGYNYNTFSWTDTELETNTNPSSGEVKSTSKIGIALNIPSYLQSITFKSFQIFERVSDTTGTTYINIPPYFFLENFTDINEQNYQGDAEKASKELSYKKIIKLFLGDKEEI